MAAGSIVIDLLMKTGSFETDTQRATANLKKMEQGTISLGRSLKTLAPLLSIGAITAYSKSILDTADSLGKLSLKTGVATKDLASLKAAAELSDTSIDEVGRAIGRLTLSFGQAQQGSQETANSLERLGITSKDARERFFQLADAYQKSGGDARVLADIQKVVGKSYQDLIPLLSQGAEGLRQSAIESASFADAMARLAPDAEKFNDQLTNLKTSAAGFASEILTKVLPVMLKMLDNINLAIRLSAQYPGGFVGLILQGINPTGTASRELVTVEKDIKRFQELVGNLERVGASPKTIQQQKDKLNGLLAIRDLLQDQIKLEQQIAQPKAKPKLPEDIKQYTKTTKAVDPLAGLLSQTEVAKIKQIEQQLILLDQRFKGAKKNTDEYRQAVAILVKQLEALSPALIDVFNNSSYQTTDTAVADFIRDQQEAINALNKELADEAQQQINAYRSQLESLISDTTLAKTEKLYQNIDILNRAFFDGIIGIEQYDEAIKLITGQDAPIEKVKKKTEETIDIAKELGLTFASAFEDAIIAGKSFKDILASIAQDILRLMIRTKVTAPMANFFGSLDLGSMFGFANGGIMTSAGPVPLHAYAGGGIANKPQMALFGEGSSPEAFVPLPDGRRIPVALQGGSGFQQNVTINVSAPTGKISRESMQQLQTALGAATQRAMRRNG